MLTSAKVTICFGIYLRFSLLFRKLTNEVGGFAALLGASRFSSDSCLKQKTASVCGYVMGRGEKEGIGKTVIIQQSDGIDVWYGNLSTTTMKLYDYVEDNAIIGEAKENKLYMIFQKDGVEIDYKEVLK